MPALANFLKPPVGTAVRILAPRNDVGDKIVCRLGLTGRLGVVAAEQNGSERIVVQIGDTVWSLEPERVAMLQPSGRGRLE